jgi:hypothetical protein
MEKKNMEVLWNFDIMHKFTQHESMLYCQKNKNKILKIIEI